MYIAREIIYYLFMTYFVLLMVRIFGSWIPPLQNSKFMRFVGFYTDPYLNLFRKIIPPIGGMIDLSPVVAFIVLQVAQQVVLSFIR